MHRTTWRKPNTPATDLDMLLTKLPTQLLTYTYMVVLKQN